MTDYLDRARIARCVKAATIGAVGGMEYRPTHNGSMRCGPARIGPDRGPGSGPEPRHGVAITPERSWPE